MRSISDFIGNPPSLRTQRLHLRQPTGSDIPEIVEIAGKLEVARNLARVPHPYGVDDARYFIDVVAPGELTWVMIERAMDRIVGVAGLSPDPETGNVELGYYVGHAWWGRGIATEAASVILAFGIALAGRDHVVARHLVDNPASGRVLEKLGFVKAGESVMVSLATGLAAVAIDMRLG